MTDLPDQTRIAEALQERTRDLNRFFDLSPDLLCIADAQGRFLKLNKGWEGVLGYRLEDLEGEFFLNFVHPEDVAATREAMEALSAGKEITDFSNRYRCRDGSYRWLEWRSAPYQEGLSYAVARDITDRIQAEEALRESGTRLQTIIAGAPFGAHIYRLESDGSLIFQGANRVADRMLHLDHRKFIGKTIEAAFPGLVGTEVPEAYRRVAAGGEPYEVERVDYNSGGITGAFEIHAFQTGPREMAVFFIDITERKQAEEALRISEEKYRSFIENSPIGMFTIDLRGDFTYINKKLLALTGYQRTDLLHRSFQPLVHPDDLPLVLARIQRRVDGQGIAEPYEIRIFHASGQVRWVKIWAESIWEARPDGQESLAGIQSFVEDITDRKVAEQALKQSEDRFKQAFDTSPDSVIINRLEDGLFVDINQGFTNMTGFTREDVIGRTSLDINIWHDQADRVRLVRQLQEHGYCENLEARFRRKDGSLTTALLSARVLLLGGVPHFISITRDISERIRAAEETKKLEAQLRQVQKMEALGTLAGGIAHDFNNILGAILGFTQLALFDLPEGSELRSNLDQVLRACDRARDLVKQILAFSRLGELEKAPLHLLPVVKEALKLLRASLPTSLEIRQKLEIKEDLILGDPTQVHQVLMNLCTNAAQAIQAGRGVIEVGLEDVVIPAGHPTILPGLKPGPYVRLTVRDTGEGIPPGIMDQIFDPFFTTKNPGEGTGMGLAVVHGIVKSHGGEISVTSQPGQGSIFQVYLPRIRAGEESQGRPAPITPTGTERILFVDDEPGLVATWTRILERWGYRVTSRLSSLEALEIFKAAPDRFDLVITDQTMPGLTGVELARELLSLRPNLPIILCSGYSSAINPDLVSKAGIGRFLLKPVLPLDMGTTLRSLLERKDG